MVINTTCITPVIAKTVVYWKTTFKSMHTRHCSRKTPILYLVWCVYQWLCYHDGNIEDKFRYKTRAQEPVYGFKTTLVLRSMQQECEWHWLMHKSVYCSLKMSIEIKPNHMLMNKA